MNLADAPLREAWREGSLTGDQAAQLAASDPVDFRDDLRFTAAIASLLAVDEAAFSRSLSERLRAESELPIFAQRLKRHLRRRKSAGRGNGWLIVGALAALLVLGLGLTLGEPSRSASQPPAPIARAPASPTSPPASPTIVARVTSVTAATRRGLALTAGQSLLAADTVESREGITVALARAADLRAGPGTRFTLGVGGDPGLVHLASGTLAAEVAPQAAGTSLRIRTGQAEVQVIGTAFSVEAGSTTTRIAVTRGKVAVIDLATEERRELTAGEDLTIGTPPAWRSLLAGGLTDWDQLRGDWRMIDGVLIGSGDAESRCRLATKASLGDLRLRMRRRARDAVMIEIQFADYRSFAEIPGERTGDWCAIEATWLNGRLSATCDGAPLVIHEGRQGGNAGFLSIYAFGSGRLELAAIDLLPLDTTP